MIIEKGIREMKEWNWFRKFLQYGYDLDVLDKYRDAVARYNRSALNVLSAAGFAVSLVALVVAMGRKYAGGVPFSMFLLAASAGGMAISRLKTSSKRMILIGGYALMLAYYALAIHAGISMTRDAFWVGVSMAVGCYLLDNSLRMFALQATGFIAYMMAIEGAGLMNGERFVVNLAFLILSMVTVYTLGRARLGLIMSREVTKKQADTDRLTGLMNRTAAKEEIEAHLNGTEESGVLILLDLDRFKSVNDKLGHQAGDKVLTDVAADLKKMFRSTDVLSRLGGDEFIIYMKKVPEQEWATQRAEQVVRTVRRWVGDGTTNIQVTASVGVVTSGDVERDYQEMYRAADIAMYFSKAEGGNNAVHYSKDLLSKARTQPATTREDGNAEEKEN
jgi:diguanylate cyclase (GGDEF)-like protein